MCVFFSILTNGKESISNGPHFIVNWSTGNEIGDEGARFIAQLTNLAHLEIGSEFLFSSLFSLVLMNGKKRASHMVIISL